MSIEPVLRWAADQVGTSARIVAVKGMRAGAGPWRLGIDHGGETVEAVLRIGDPDIGSRRRLATEAAALALAVELDGDTTGRPALLMTVLAGSSTIPTIASVVRLRASGAAAAALHAVATTPRPDLPLRVRPLGDVDFAAQRRVSGSSPLLDAAEQRLHVLPMPQRMSVFVHGDLWQGNTLWAGEACVGMVDWDAAGVGHPGIDLGSLRCDAAIMFGLPAAAEILDGWRQERPGRRRRGVLGPGGRADHPDRHGDLAAGGPRPRPRRPRRPDPEPAARRISARRARPPRPPAVAVTLRRGALGRGLADRAALTAKTTWRSLRLKTTVMVAGGTAPTIARRASC